jgi:hypothetical protein
MSYDNIYALFLHFYKKYYRSRRSLSEFFANLYVINGALSYYFLIYFVIDESVLILYIGCHF